MPTALTTSFRVGRRCPLAGVALAAVVGIGLAESWRVCFADDPGETSTPRWVALTAFLLVAAVWAWGRRAVWFWGALGLGYAVLHLFASDPVPATALARVLASSPGAIATGHDPSHGTARVLHAFGHVLDVPRLVPPTPGAPLRSTGPTWIFRLRLDDAEVAGSRGFSGAVVAAQWRDAVAELSPGDRLEITALAENLAPPRNPGEFDRAAHLRRQGVLSAVRIVGVADGRILPPPPGVGHYLSAAPVRRLAGGLHAWMERTLRLDLEDDPEAAAIVSTALLGLASPPGLGDLENVFQRTGTLHYFAVDGLKLGLVSFLLLRALAALGVRRPWTGILVLPLVLGYTLATGLGAASARALIVAFVLLGGEWVDRPTQAFNSLGGAAAGLLLFNPPQLFDLGFQLTFSVMLGILFLERSLAVALGRLGAPDPFLPPALFSPAYRVVDYLRRRTCDLTAVSIAAWVGSLPIMFVTFHLVSPISLLANVVTFPLAFAVLALGVLSLAGATVSTTLAVSLNNANWLAAKSFLWLVRAFDAVPGGSFAVASPSHWHWPAPAAEMVVYDFDRGRAASLRAGRADWLFDAARLAEFSQGVLPCLRARAVERLDGGLILTQGDADHLAAAQLAFTDLHPARIVESALARRTPLLRDFRAVLAAQHRTETFCRLGDVLPLGDGTRARVLYPPDDLSGIFRSAADRALALEIEAAGWQIILLTEGNGAAAQWLATHAKPGSLVGAVLVTSAPVSPELLAVVRPRLLVLRPPIVKESAGGRPTQPLDVSIATAVPTLIQRESGAVTLLIYPDHLEASGFVDKSTTILKK